MKTLIVLIVFLSIVISGESQNQNSLITSELEQIKNQSNLVGFGVAILNKDSIVYAKGFGFSNNIELIKWEVESNNEEAIRFYRKLGAEVNNKSIVKWHIS